MTDAPASPAFAATGLSSTGFSSTVDEELERAAALGAAADEWLSTGLATGPTDRAAAEAGVRAAYAAAGLKQPDRIVWFASPFAGALAAGLVSGPDRDGDPTRTGDPVLAGIAAELSAQGWAGGPVGRSVRPLVRTAPWATARAEVTRRLGTAGWAQHWASGAGRTWPLIQDRLVTPLRTRLTDDFDARTGEAYVAARDALLDAVYGQHDAAWLAAFAGTTEPGRSAGIAALAGIARSAGWWWAYERLAIVTERPVALHRDNLGRLHHGAGPALSYADGFGLHVWRGMPIPPEVADVLPRLTVERIRAEENAEVRRVMLEHYGYDRYLRDSHATQVHRDETGILWRVNLPGDEPLVMVEVVNSTPEPDGTRRTYFLRVPPRTRRAREGVAWTFGLSEEEYTPLVQT